MEAGPMHKTAVVLLFKIIGVFRKPMGLFDSTGQ